MMHIHHKSNSSNATKHGMFPKWIKSKVENLKASCVVHNDDDCIKCQLTKVKDDTRNDHKPSKMK